MSLLPGAWYLFITSSYICNAAIGFNLSYVTSSWIGAGLALIYAIAVWKKGVSMREAKIPLEEPAVL
jgi:hypothetical protein